MVAAVTVAAIAGTGLAVWTPGQAGAGRETPTAGTAPAHAHLARPAPAASGAAGAGPPAGLHAPAGAGAGGEGEQVRVVNGRRQPPRVEVPASASGRYRVVPGSAAPPRPQGRARGRLVRYAVEVERGLPFAAAGFAAEVHRVLNDPRGWGRGGRAMRFQRVARGPVAFRVSLSSPRMTDRMCLPLDTGGRLSCHRGVRSVINARRWGAGARPYGGDLAAYREYLISHEVGHALGHGHRDCPGRGRRAPVMVQQTKSLYGCRANPWPFPRR